MDYSKSVLIYQDNPAYGLTLKFVLGIVPVASLAESIYLLLSGESTDAILLLVEALVVSLIFWSVLPRSYQVYEDHLRIVLGGPFCIKVGFSQIESIRITSKITLSLNFVTKFVKNCVEINKKRGLSIAITPREKDMFIENANSAMSQWLNTKTG